MLKNIRSIEGGISDRFEFQQHFVFVCVREKEGAIEKSLSHSQASQSRESSVHPPSRPYRNSCRLETP